MTSPYQFEPTKSDFCDDYDSFNTNHNKFSQCFEALSPKRLKRKYICSEHFGKNEYINPHATKSRLMPNAVPKKYLNVKNKSPKSWSWNVEDSPIAEMPVNETIDTTPVKLIRNRAVMNSDMPSPVKTTKSTNTTLIKSPTKLALKNNILQEKLNRIRRLLKQKRTIIKSLKAKMNNNTAKKDINIVTKFFNQAQFPSINSKALINMQIMHKKRKPWSKAEKKLALAIYYKSPSTYKYMKKNGIILPGESTVRHWLNSINYTTGFPPKYMEQIKHKTSDMSYDEKKCVILLDEVSIMKAIEYNKSLDEIEGFEDLGSLGRTNKLGSHALVLMVRGLYKNWKFPFSYYFTGSGIKGDSLTTIVKEAVGKLLELSLLPTCIVCDQGTQNRRMFSLLGGSEKNPSTVICNKKIFLIYDAPHLLKSVRNNLMNGDFLIDNNIISFKDIQKTYELDNHSETAKSMCKLTPIHLFPNSFQKMSCKLAIQLFSRSVSAAIKTCVSTGQLTSSSAIHTAEFIDIMNDMFDTFNSKNLYDPNPNRRPLCDTNTVNFRNLEKARTIFQKAVKISKTNKKSSIPPCFVGIIWTTTALVEVFQSEKYDSGRSQTKKEYFLLTNRLTQDALENFFSIMRQKNGYVQFF
ncbi:hypothetical protein QTP88_018552 [Uroleucon formosanum]